MFGPGRTATVACAALLIVVAGCSGDKPAQTAGPGDAQHVLLLSIDGMHQSDLTGYVQADPNTALAALVGRGIDYTNAQSPDPPDSFPGLIAQVTVRKPRKDRV